MTLSEFFYSIVGLQSTVNCFPFLSMNLLSIILGKCSRCPVLVNFDELMTTPNIPDQDEFYKILWELDRLTETSLVEKNAFLARILQDFLSRSCKIMHFSARHLARVLQGKKFPRKILPRRKISWNVLDNFLFFIFIVFDFKLTTASWLLDSAIERGLFTRGFNHQKDANSRKYL